MVSTLSNNTALIVSPFWITGPSWCSFFLTTCKGGFRYREKCSARSSLTYIFGFYFVCFFFLVSCSLYVDCRWFNSITAESHHVLLTVLSCDIACLALVEILIDDGRKGVFAEQTKQGTVITNCHTEKRLQGMSINNSIMPDTVNRCL